MPVRTGTVGTTPTQVMAYNNRRTTVSLTNVGTATIYLSDSQTDITNQGYPIEVGGAYDMLRALGDQPNLQWFAEVAAATQEIRIIESFGDLPVMFTPPELPSIAQPTEGG